MKKPLAVSMLLLLCFPVRMLLWILPAAAMIASVTAVLSIAGVLIGRRFGAILQTKAQVLGGLILIGIGIRIFVSHVFA